MTKNKPGPKPGSTREMRTAERMQKFNGFPVVTQAPKTVKDFNTKIQDIANCQLAKLHQKSVTSNLDLSEIKIVVELAKLNTFVNSSEESPEITDELVSQALKFAANSKETNGNTK